MVCAMASGWSTAFFSELVTRCLSRTGGQFIGVIARDLADIVVDLIEGIVAGH